MAAFTSEPRCGLVEISLGEVVAERRLRWAGDDGSSEDVAVRIGKPVPAPDTDGDWLCPVQVVGMGDDRVYAAFGVDSVQALILALQMVDVNLRAGQRRAGRTLLWLDQGDLGFLLPAARD